MSEEAPKTTSTRKPRAKQPEAKPTVFPGGTYVQRGENALVFVTLQAGVVTSEYVGVHLSNPLGFNEKLRLPLVDLEGGVPGWTYVGGGVPLEDVLKAGV